MAKFLASVTSLVEARMVVAAGVDIVDLKQPAEGALGALNVETVSAIVNGLDSAVQISATIGDLPLLPGLILPAVQAMLDQGVNIVKLGIFPGSEPEACLTALLPITAQGHQLVAVLFADTNHDLALIPHLANAGFSGVMLDTMNKSLGSLTTLASQSQLLQFVQSAHQHDLFCGLAGSLRVNDVPELLPLKADYLGFRGALCRGQQRTATLDIDAVRTIRRLLTP